MIRDYIGRFWHWLGTFTAVRIISAALFLYCAGLAFWDDGSTMHALHIASTFGSIWLLGYYSRAKVEK